MTTTKLYVFALTAVMASTASPAAAFFVTVLDASRDLHVDTNIISPIDYSFAGDGMYSLSLQEPNGQAEAEFISSDIPASGSYTNYMVSADMMVTYSDLLGSATSGEASATLSLSFDLDSPVNYLVFTNGPGYGFTLNGPSGTVFQDPWNSGGLLSIGQYELVASINVLDPGIIDFGNSDSFGFQMTMSAVPIPAALWLFGSGLLGLIGVTRRKH